MAKTIGIVAIKGGVGKTTIAASLASDLVNSYKKKVLLVDANYSAPNLGLHMDVVEPGNDEGNRGRKCRPLAVDVRDVVLAGKPGKANRLMPQAACLKEEIRALQIKP